MNKKTLILVFGVFALTTGLYTLYDTLKYPKGEVVIKQMSEVSEDGRPLYFVITDKGQMFDYLYAEEIANGLLTGNWNPDETLRLYPQYQYQLTLDPDSLVVSDFGRIVATIPYNQTGVLDSVFIADNE